jgi:integrase/recombinase XerD
LEQYRRRLVVQNYSESTINSYLAAIRDVILFVGKTTNKITSEEIYAYLLYLKEGKGLSRDTMRINVSAFRHYYRNMEDRPDIIEDVPYPKKIKHLPIILTSKEVKLLLNKTHNVKHRLILKLAYSAGLRRGEIRNLKQEDINVQNMTIRVNQGKGLKDRYTILAKNTLLDLQIYQQEYSYSEWLFNGRVVGTQISEGALRWVHENARHRAKIKRKMNLHSLRHSFASHLLATGVNLVFIQRLLGHEDLRTTLIYLHTNLDEGRKIISPLDYIYPNE